MAFSESPVFRQCRSAVLVAAVLLPLLFLATGCATYSDKLKNLKPQLARGEFDKALETVEKESGSKDRLLYYLERGLILHYADRFAESNEAFAAAERTADDLYTKSISEGAFSLFSNDNAISYRARPFEMAMVPYYKGLNYIYLGDREAALVEARRASLLMSKYVDATLDGLREQDKGDFEKIRNNPFLLYFSGMLYDWDGDLNDAFVAYRNAAVAYQQNHRSVECRNPAHLGTGPDPDGRPPGFSQRAGPVASRPVPMCLCWVRTMTDCPGRARTTKKPQPGGRGTGKWSCCWSRVSWPRKARSGSTSPFSRGKPTTIRTTGPGRSTRAWATCRPWPGGGRWSTGSRWPRRSWTISTPVPWPEPG